MLSLATPGFVEEKELVHSHRDMATTSYITDEKGNTTIDKKADTRAEANAALPSGPIKPPGRFIVSVSTVTPVGEFERFIPGRTYNIDQTTKDALDKANAILVCDPA